MKLLLVNALIVVVLYSNVAVIANYPLERALPGFSLPLPRQLYDGFILFGIFSYYERVNHDIEIHGILASPSATAESDVIRLDRNEHFPFSRGEFRSRCFVSKHDYMRGTAGRDEAWKALTAKIRARHNRLHPDTPVRAIGLVELTWPRSLDGYDAMKTDESVNYQLLFSE